MTTCTDRLCRGGLAIAVATALFRTGSPLAQTAGGVPVTLDPVVVTATRGMDRLFDVPASADVIDGATIRDGQPAISLSESLVRVPGVGTAAPSGVQP